MTRAEAELESARLELEQALPRELHERDRLAQREAEQPAPNAAPAAPASGGRAEPERRAEKKTGAPAAKRAAADSARAQDVEAVPREPAAPASGPANACERACKALTSLERAKAAICRLDVPGGARCAHAESILRDATARVASCACGD